MAAVYLEFCAMRAFFRASWGGFGDPGMEYTPSGMVIGYIIVYVPVSLLLLILVLHMIMHYRRKVAIKYYFYDILFCIAAVGHKETFDFVWDLIKDQAPLSESIIKQIHYLLLSDKREDRGLQENSCQDYGCKA